MMMRAWGIGDIARCVCFFYFISVVKVVRDVGRKTTTRVTATVTTITTAIPTIMLVFMLSLLGSCTVKARLGTAEIRVRGTWWR